MSGHRAKLRRKLGTTESVRDWSALDLRMLRDDVNWIASLGEASQGSRHWQSCVGLALTPHMARVVFEGMDLLERRRPAQAKAVKLRFAPQIEAARHTVKLLDDTQKLYEGTIQDFKLIDDEHSAAWTRGRNFATGLRDERIFSTSRSAQFQQSGRLAEPAPAKSYSHNFGYDIGQAAMLIVRQFGYAPQFVPLPTEHWGPPPLVVELDREEYYETRFEPDFPLELKDILCVIEGAVNTCLHIFKPAQGPFVSPVFRVSFVTASHALTSLDEVRSKFPDLAKSQGMTRLSEVLDSPEALRIRSLRKLRNRCMHYLIPTTLDGLSEHLPVYGLVEATSPGLSYEIVQADLEHVLSSVSDVFHLWRQDQ